MPKEHILPWDIKPLSRSKRCYWKKRKWQHKKVSYFKLQFQLILQSKMLMVMGKLQIEGEVIHVIAESCHNMNKLLRIDLGVRDIGSVHKPARADEKDGGGTQGDLFKSRDFK